jgi:hypothetical protein
LLGLVTDEQDVKAMPRADYSLSFQEVLWTVAEYLLRRYQTLDLLAWAVRGPTQNEQSLAIESLPSWIPDWRLLRRSWPINSNLRVATGIRKTPLFDASLRSETAASPVFYPIFMVVLMRLMVHSLHIDSVCKIFDSEITHTSAENIVDNVVYHNGGPGQSQYVTGERMAQACWMTLFADQWEFDDARLYEVQRISKNKDTTSLPFSIPPERGDLNTLHRAIRDRQTYWQDRRFFRTQNGYLGLAPLGSQPGDIVAIIFGASTPFVLRPQRGGEG